MVTEQIANLSTRKCRLGSSPSLSAIAHQAWASADTSAEKNITIQVHDIM